MGSRCQCKEHKTPSKKNKEERNEGRSSFRESGGTIGIKYQNNLINLRGKLYYSRI